jgi:uncharacterized membrane protein YphA (DoxX/SURF4 family)
VADGYYGREEHMETVRASVDRLEIQLTEWMARNAIALLRVSLGIVFFWFGALKFFPGLSPAEDLAARTISMLTFGIVQPNISLPVLAAWECAIGLGLITGRCLRATLVLLFAQMAGTVLPLFFFPKETWSHLPYAATLEGQYIIKNVVLVSAGLVIGATVRGGALVVAPALAARLPKALALGPLPILEGATASLCASPDRHCRTVLVDAALLPPDVRAAFQRIRESRLDA